MKIDFDPKYVQKILSGKKRATIRRGIRQVKPGDVVVLTADNKPFATAQIVRVSLKRVSELTNADARKDGYRSVQRLKHELRRFYPKLGDDDIVTIIEFEVDRQ